MASFDLRANRAILGEKAAAEQRRRSDPRTAALWRALVLVYMAHARQLRAAGVVDERGLAAIARALDAVLRAVPEGTRPVSALLQEAQARADAVLPAEIAGAATLGLSRVETIATALRLRWRESGLAMHEAALALRAALLELADAHAVTVMAAVWGGRPASPTTLAHFLGGVVGPLALASRRMQQALDVLDRSPLGAGVLAGDVLEAERETLATALGFAGPIHNTLDALGSVEDLVPLVDATLAALAAVRRFVDEVLAWIRTDPTSFFLDEAWEEAPEPSMPALAVSGRLERLRFALQEAELAGRAAIEFARSLPYGPLGTSWDTLAGMMDDALDRGRSALAEAQAAVREGIIVNRAYLANRAGRQYTTAADLVPFLMTEEALPPAAARQIAALVVSRLREQHLEASAVTQDIIDSAALMVIGRELKVEMETLGRYLAPRRFIERRSVLGSPARERTQEWLRAEREQLDADRAWAGAQRERWTGALLALEEALVAAGEIDE